MLPGNAGNVQNHNVAKANDLLTAHAEPIHKVNPGIYRGHVLSSTQPVNYPDLEKAGPGAPLSQRNCAVCADSRAIRDIVAQQVDQEIKQSRERRILFFDFREGYEAVRFSDETIELLKASGISDQKIASAIKECQARDRENIYKRTNHGFYLADDEIFQVLKNGLDHYITCYDFQPCFEGRPSVEAMNWNGRKGGAGQWETVTKSSLDFGQVKEILVNPDYLTVTLLPPRSLAREFYLEGDRSRLIQDRLAEYLAKVIKLMDSRGTSAGQEAASQEKRPAVDHSQQRLSAEAWLRSINDYGENDDPLQTCTPETSNQLITFV